MPFAKAGLSLKLRALVNPVSDLAAYHDAGIHTFLVQLLSPQPGEQPTSAQAFVDYFAPAVEAFVREGVRDFEIHGEPNQVGRGYAISWADPAAFGEWDTLTVTIQPCCSIGPCARLVPPRALSGPRGMPTSPRGAMLRPNHV